MFGLQTKMHKHSILPRGCQGGTWRPKAFSTLTKNLSGIGITLANPRCIPRIKTPKKNIILGNSSLKIVISTTLDIFLFKNSDYILR